MAEYDYPATVGSYGRVGNKNTPLDDTDNTELNASWINEIPDSILTGDVRSKFKTWTTATRPATAPGGGSLESGDKGLNTDTGENADDSYAIEIYLVNLGWLVLQGSWADAGSRPTGVIAGSKGWNRDETCIEYYDGVAWQPMP